jgi:quinol monooxygenase YgiN
MSIAAMVEFETIPAMREELVAYLRDILPDTRNYEGCLGATFHADQDRPNHLIVFLRWTSMAHFERYTVWRQEMGAADRIASLLSTVPIRRLLDEIDT